MIALILELLIATAVAWGVWIAGHPVIAVVDSAIVNDTLFRANVSFLVFPISLATVVAPTHFVSDKGRRRTPRQSRDHASQQTHVQFPVGRRVKGVGRSRYQ